MSQMTHHYALLITEWIFHNRRCADTYLLYYYCWMRIWHAMMWMQEWQVDLWGRRSMQKGGAGVGLAMATTKHSQMEKVKYKSKSQEHWIRSNSPKRKNGNHSIIHSDQEWNVTTNENQETLSLARNRLCNHHS